MSIQKDFGTAVEQAAQDVMRDTRGEAIRLSSGTMTEAERVAMDYPFAKRHAQPLAPAEIINSASPDNTGEFLRSWSQPTVQVSADGPEGLMTNDSRVADFLRLGTQKMHERPIEGEVEAYAGTELERRIPDAVDAALG